MKKAFVFSGQGAQYVGMLKELASAYPVVDQTIQEASQLLGYDIGELLFYDEVKLNQTQFTQPAIFTMEVAILRLLDSLGVTPDVTAGLSLGEYSALVAAKVLNFDEALLLLEKRALFMQEASMTVSSKMYAVLSEDRTLVEQVCHQLQNQHLYVAPANYNMPGQIVIAGKTEACDMAAKLLTEAGVKRCVPLAVSGAFHTELMQEAAEKLQPYLQKQNWKEPVIPIISNTYAKDMGEIDLSISTIMEQQMTHPVYFEDSIRYMVTLGVDVFIEIGPKKVLSQFIKKIDKEKQITNVEDEASLQRTIQLLKGEAV